MTKEQAELIAEGRYWVSWFVSTIRSFGGEYIPCHDTGAHKQHTSGRRESKRESHELDMSEYYFDKHASLRRA